MEHPENDNAYKGLQVNSGVSSQPIVNPYRHKRATRPRRLTAAEYVEGIMSELAAIKNKNSLKN